VADTGLPFAFLVELSCKHLYFGGVLTLGEISERMGLPVSVAWDILEFMKKERLAEVKKGGDVRASYVHALTDLGRERAREYLLLSGYAGPAPVPLSLYAKVSEEQTVRGMKVDRATMRDAFDGVVLPPDLLDRLGPAVNSGRSIFLYGASGTGKTFLAERLARVLSGTVNVPHAILVDHAVIRLFDPVVHRRVEGGDESSPEELLASGGRGYDRRFVPCRRPVVVAGGELVLSMLDLSFDVVSRFYEAPLQLKANGGVFLIDDLGRQQVRPFDLLNRWIVPLERGKDYLALQNGKKFEIPFDQIVLFSTNIEPRKLADEAFLRRIGYKIHVDHVSEADYTAICRQVADRIGLPWREEVVRYLIDQEHGVRKIPLSACHPGDILSRMAEICVYEGVAPRMDEVLARRACRDYFTEL
jgi:hypothetical protein